jgi:hypothetical protein
MNQNFFNNSTANQEGTEMVTTIEKWSFVDNTQIQSIIIGISDQEFLTLYKWEMDCLIAISKGKVKACELLSKIGDANCSSVFTNVINQIIIVETVNPRDELLTLLQRESTKKPVPISIGTGIGKGITEVAKFIGSVVSASNVVVTFAIAEPKANKSKTTKLPNFKK